MVSESAYLNLLPHGELPDFKGEPFIAVLLVEASVEEEWMKRCCEWLVRSGCLYVVVWGHDCEAWHDNIDRANIADFVGKDIPPAELVMTTFHDGELLSEALWFASWQSHPHVKIERTVILHIALDEREAELLAAFKKARDV